MVKIILSQKIKFTCSCSEAIGMHELDSFPGVGWSRIIRDTTDGSHQRLFVQMRVHIEFSFVIGGEGVNSDLYVIGSNVKVLGNPLDKLQHFLEVGGSHTSGWIQKEDNVCLGTTTWRNQQQYKIKIIYRLTTGQYGSFYTVCMFIPVLLVGGGAVVALTVGKKKCICIYIFQKYLVLQNWKLRITRWKICTYLHKLSVLTLR